MGKSHGLIEGLTGSDLHTIDPQEKVVVHVGECAPLVLHLENHGTMGVLDAIPFPVHTVASWVNKGVEQCLSGR